MSYATPHHAHEFMKAACLAVVHQFVLACQRKQVQEKKSLLLRWREIDFNARLAMYFGPEAAISAQGVKDSDLRISSPVQEVELKYCRPKAGGLQPVNHWNQVIDKDWKWLLQLGAAGDRFKKTAWVVFFPAVQLFTFHQCFQVPHNKLVNGQIPRQHFAPFVELAIPDQAHPTQLIYQTTNWERDVILQRQGVGSPIRVRRQLIGNPQHPIWALIFSRVGSKGIGVLQHLPTYAF